MGQDPDFSDTISSLREGRKLDLVSRFTLRRLPFRGLQFEEDIKAILEQIDSLTYPEGSDCTWTQFFAPEAWGAGFRLASQANFLIEAINEVTPGTMKAQGVSARQLFLAIRNALTMLGGLVRPIDDEMREIWSESVAYALIRDAAIVANLRKSSKRRVAL